LGPCGIAIGALVPSARLRPLRRRTLQPLLAVESAQLLVVQSDALAGEQDVEAAVAEPAPHRGKLAQPRPHGGIVRADAAIAHRRPVCSKR